MPRTAWITSETVRAAARCAPARRCLCLLLALGLMAGCSSRVFFYNRLPLLLPWYLGRYVDLDRQQSDAFDGQVARLLAWHRREELPRYAALIARLQSRLDGPVDPGAVAAVTEELEDAWVRLRERALDELLLLGGTLSEAQLQEFLAALEKRQRKYERKYLRRSDARYREDASDNLRDFLGDYLGRLDDRQLAALRAAAAQLQRSDRTWIAERQRWIDMLREELRRRPGWQQRIRERIRGWEDALDPDSRDLYEHNTAVVQRAIAQVLDNRSRRQDARLARELEGLREDLLQLAAAAAAAASAAPAGA